MVSKNFYGNPSRWDEGGGGVVFELGNTAAKGRLKQFWKSRLKKVVKKLAFHHQGVAFF